VYWFSGQTQSLLVGELTKHLPRKPSVEQYFVTVLVSTMMIHSTKAFQNIRH